MPFRNQEEKMMSAAKFLLECGAYTIEQIKAAVITDNPYKVLKDLNNRGIIVSSFWVEEPNGKKYKKYYINKN